MLAIYFICFCIFVHFVFYFFDIDIFELFEKKKLNETEMVEIDNTIIELQQSMEELKDVSRV